MMWNNPTYDRFFCFISSQLSISLLLCPRSSQGSSKPSGMCAIFKQTGSEQSNNADYHCGHFGARNFLAIS